MVCRKYLRFCVHNIWDVHMLGNNLCVEFKLNWENIRNKTKKMFELWNSFSQESIGVTNLTIFWYRYAATCKTTVLFLWVLFVALLELENSFSHGLVNTLIASSMCTRKPNYTYDALSPINRHNADWKNSVDGWGQLKWLTRSHEILRQFLGWAYRKKDIQHIPLFHDLW